MDTEKLLCFSTFVAAAIILFLWLRQDDPRRDYFSRDYTLDGSNEYLPIGCTSTAGGDIMMCPCGGHCLNGSQCKANLHGCKY
jgi:hypothetical protein